jgi:hypothetical protein
MSVYLAAFDRYLYGILVRVRDLMAAQVYV